MFTIPTRTSLNQKENNLISKESMNESWAIRGGCCPAVRAERGDIGSDQVADTARETHFILSLWGAGQAEGQSQNLKPVC